MDNGFYKDQYFKQLNERIDTLEKKIDDLSNKVNWIYAFASGVGAVSAFIINLISK